jgi:hypothetical protein
MENIYNGRIVALISMGFNEKKLLLKRSFISNFLPIESLKVMVWTGWFARAVPSSGI